MAKNKEEKSDQPKARFAVTHRKGVMVGNLTFEQGYGLTDNATLAHASQEYGCEVIDTSTGEKVDWEALAAKKAATDGAAEQKTV